MKKRESIRDDDSESGARRSSLQVQDTEQRVRTLPGQVHTAGAADTYRWCCSRAPWSPSSWLSGRLSSIGRSGTRSLWRTDRGVRPGGTTSASAPTGSPPGAVLLTVRVDLRLEFLGGDVREVAGAQAPHVHPLCRPRCHGRTQSRGLRHGGSHWTDRRQTQEEEKGKTSTCDGSECLLPGDTRPLKKKEAAEVSGISKHGRPSVQRLLVTYWSGLYTHQYSCALTVHKQI